MIARKHLLALGPAIAASQTYPFGHPGTATQYQRKFDVLPCFSGAKLKLSPGCRRTVTAKQIRWGEAISSWCLECAGVGENLYPLCLQRLIMKEKIHKDQYTCIMVDISEESSISSLSEPTRVRPFTQELEQSLLALSANLGIFAMIQIGLRWSTCDFDFDRIRSAYCCLGRVTRAVDVQSEAYLRRVVSGIGIPKTYFRSRFSHMPESTMGQVPRGGKTR